MDAVKEQLRSLAADYERPLRGKFAVLMPLREEIIELERKGASTGEIAAMLAQCQVAVSKDTVGRFLRMEKKERSSPRAKKTRRRGATPRQRERSGQADDAAPDAVGEPVSQLNTKG